MISDMKKMAFIILLLSAIAFMTSCEKNDDKQITEIKIKTSFNTLKQGIAEKSIESFTYETPQEYLIAIKSARLIGAGETEDFLLFDMGDLASSVIYNFTDDTDSYSLLQGNTIPEGDYEAIQMEIYYQQMLISIMTIDRGLEYRNYRIYLSDDAEVEEGLHQPGDMCQVNDGVEIGWLMGEAQYPNMDPVTPRDAAYTHNGDCSSWYDFAGKNAQNFGPFGSLEFMLNAPQPIYHALLNFNYEEASGEELVIDFNINNAWQFEDKNGDGHFGAEDLDENDPSEWHLAMPEITVSFN
jgi:hypothetical protein